MKEVNLNQDFPGHILKCLGQAKDSRDCLDEKGTLSRATYIKAMQKQWSKDYKSFRLGYHRLQVSTRHTGVCVHADTL